MWWCNWLVEHEEGKEWSRSNFIYIAGVGVAPPQLVTAKVRLRLQCDLTYLVTATLMQVLWIQRDPDRAWRYVEQPIIHYVLKIRTFCVLQYWEFSILVHLDFIVGSLVLIVGILFVGYHAQSINMMGTWCIIDSWLNYYWV